MIADELPAATRPHARVDPRLTDGLRVPLSGKLIHISSSTKRPRQRSVLIEPGGHRGTPRTASGDRTASAPEEAPCVEQVGGSIAVTLSGRRVTRCGVRRVSADRYIHAHGGHSPFPRGRTHSADAAADMPGTLVVDVN